jgi:hypothetical protein
MSLSIFFKKIINAKNPLIIEKMEVDFFVSRNLNKKKLRIVDKCESR